MSVESCGTMILDEQIKKLVMDEFIKKLAAEVQKETNTKKDSKSKILEVETIVQVISTPSPDNKNHKPV